MSIFEEVKNKFVLPNANSDWEEYRKMLTDTVIRYAEKCHAKSVSIIGAGHCNDIDILRLSQAFDKIYFVDYDLEAMNEAVGRNLKNGNEKIETRNVSLTGFSEKDISDFYDNVIRDIRLCGRNINKDSYRRIVSQRMDALEAKTTNLRDHLASVLPKSDITVCNGVFSQLFSGICFFINSCSASLLELVPDAISITMMVEERLKSLNDKVVPVITEKIRESANEYSIFGNEHSETKPVEGACQCIREISASDNICEEFKTVWDFNMNEDVKYEMLIQIVALKNDPQ